MKQKDLERLSNVLTAIYRNCRGKSVSVREHPIIPIYTEHKFWAADQKLISEYLKANLLFWTGNNMIKTYKWKGILHNARETAQEIITTCLKLDAPIVEEPVRIKRKYTVTAVKEPVPVPEPESKVAKRKSRHFITSVDLPRKTGDKGYVIYNDRIYEAYIYKVTQLPGQEPDYELLITDDGINCILRKGTLSLSVKILLAFLESNIHTFNDSAEMWTEPIETETLNTHDEPS